MQRVLCATRRLTVLITILACVTAGILVPGTPAGAATWSFETRDGHQDSPSGQIAQPMDGMPTASVVYRGAVHAFYVDTHRENLRHTWWTGTEWRARTIDGHRDGPNGQRRYRVASGSAAIVAGNILHVFYTVAGGAVTGLRHATWNGVSWRFESLDTSVAGSLDDTLEAPRAALVDGLPHVWWRATTGLLRHGWWDAGVWRVETLDGHAAGPNGSASGSMFRPDVLLYGGQVHLWYRGELYGPVSVEPVLRHAWWDGRQWTFETIYSEAIVRHNVVDVGDHVAAALDGDGTPHVFFPVESVLGGSSELVHGTWDGSAWQFATIDGPPPGGSYAVWWIDAIWHRGQLHVFLGELGGADLRHIRSGGGTWAAQTLDGAGGPAGRIEGVVGQGVSAVSTGTALHVFYVDWYQGLLRHAALA